MSLFAFLGAVELGLIYALVAMGTLISFRTLKFPDLTVDGSFPLGAAVSATIIVAGGDPWLSLLAAALAGGISGYVTGVIHTRFGIQQLLAGILVMIALFSVNLRIMGQPNISLLSQPTILRMLGDGFAGPGARVALLAGIVAVIFVLLVLFLRSEFGLSLRAAGANPRMASAQGVGVAGRVNFGMALSNALVAIAGGLFAQFNGFADATLGFGTIIFGLAAVVIGETLLPSRRLAVAVIACILGSVLYRLVVQFVLSTEAIGLKASDMNLATSVLVFIALVLPQMTRKATR